MASLLRDGHHRDTEGAEAYWSEPDCFVAPLLAMTADCSVIASEAKQSQWFTPVSGVRFAPLVFFSVLSVPPW